MRIRIAVATDQFGAAVATVIGETDDPRQALADTFLLDHLERGERISVVTAEVPLPEPMEIEGEVNP
jgi:hypothetical protein